MKRLSAIVVASIGAWSLALAAGCPPWGPDDDDASVEPSETPPPTSPTPGTPTAVPGTPTPQPGALTISGEVIAIDRETGDLIPADEYSQYAGKIIVYAAQDPADLSQYAGKMTLVAPGSYMLDVEQNAGQLYVMAVVDCNKDTFITARDLVREAVDSPVTVTNESLEAVDIYVEISTGSDDDDDGGGEHDGDGNGGACAPFDGTVTYSSEQPTNLAVAAFTGDYLDILDVAKVSESGPYDLCATITGVATNLIGYADADGNGLFEPSDPTGLAPANPYPLTEDGASGVDILIEGVGKPDLPMPLPYITVSGSVVVHDAYTGTPIVVSAKSSTSGVLYASTTIDGPGVFDLRVPAYVTHLVLSAITDSNGDGNLDPATDAAGQLPPFDAGGSNMGGYVITLSDPTVTTPTPEPQAAPTPTPVPEHTPTPPPTPVADPTPTPKPGELPPSGIGGTITFSGTVDQSDVLVISVFKTAYMSSDPVANAYFRPPTFPQTYLMTGFNQVLTDMGEGSHEFFVTAVLDVGGDLPDDGEVGPEDFFGAYSTDGETFAPVTVTKGTITTGIDFEVGNWNP